MGAGAEKLGEILWQRARKTRLPRWATMPPPERRCLFLARFPAPEPTADQAALVFGGCLSTIELEASTLDRTTSDACFVALLNVS